MNFDEVRSRFSGVRKSGDGYVALCPAHDDHKRSLSINCGDDGRTLLYCHAGCSIGDVCRAVDLEESDLFEAPTFSSTSTLGGEVTAYPYRSEHGQLLYENVRFEPKDFRQRRYVNGEAIWGLDGTQRVPYRLPELLDAIRREDPVSNVFLSEGEKDVDNLLSLGLTATSHKTFRPEFNEYIRGLDLVILCDHDASGIRQAEKAARTVMSSAASVKLLDLFETEPLPEKGGKDVSDWIEGRRAKGVADADIAEELCEIADRADVWKPDVPAVLKSAPIGYSLGELIKKEFPPRQEVVFGLAEGEIGIINAVTNYGKTTMLRNLAISRAVGRPFPPFGDFSIPQRVAFLDFEDGLAGVRDDFMRMRNVLSDEQRELLDENVLLICEQDVGGALLCLSDAQHLNLLIERLEEFNADLVLVDTIASGFRIKNENDNAEIRDRVFWPLKLLAKGCLAALIASHHIGKAKLEDGQAREASHRGRGASSFADIGRVVLNLERDLMDDTFQHA